MELIKIINGLDHGVSHTKLAEVGTAYSIQKTARNSGLISEEIKPYKQALLAYYKIVWKKHYLVQEQLTE